MMVSGGYVSPLAPVPAWASSSFSVATAPCQSDPKAGQSMHVQSFSMCHSASRPGVNLTQPAVNTTASANKRAITPIRAGASMVRLAGLETGCASVSVPGPLLSSGLTERGFPTGASVVTSAAPMPASCCVPNAMEFQSVQGSGSAAPCSAAAPAAGPSLAAAARLHRTVSPLPGSAAATAAGAAAAAHVASVANASSRLASPIRTRVSRPLPTEVSSQPQQDRSIVQEVSETGHTRLIGQPSYMARATADTPTAPAYAPSTAPARVLLHPTRSMLPPGNLEPKQPMGFGLSTEVSGGSVAVNVAGGRYFVTADDTGNRVGQFSTTPHAPIGGLGVRWASPLIRKAAPTSQQWSSDDCSPVFGVEGLSLKVNPPSHCAGSVRLAPEPSHSATHAANSGSMQVVAGSFALPQPSLAAAPLHLNGASVMVSAPSAVSNGATTPCGPPIQQQVSVPTTPAQTISPSTAAASQPTSTVAAQASPSTTAAPLQPTGTVPPHVIRPSVAAAPQPASMAPNINPATQTAPQPATTLPSQVTTGLPTGATPQPNATAPSQATILPTTLPPQATINPSPGVGSQPTTSAASQANINPTTAAAMQPDAPMPAHVTINPSTVAAPQPSSQSGICRPSTARTSEGSTTPAPCGAVTPLPLQYMSVRQPVTSAVGPTGAVTSVAHPATNAAWSISAPTSSDTCGSQGFVRTVYPMPSASTPVQAQSQPGASVLTYPSGNTTAARINPQVHGVQTTRPVISPPPAPAATVAAAPQTRRVVPPWEDPTQQSERRKALGLHEPQVQEFAERCEFVSLGCFCGVAFGLQVLGLTKFSYPFDWARSPATGVVQLFQTRFAEFTSFACFADKGEVGKLYGKTRWGGSFWHHDVTDLKVQTDFARRANRLLGITTEVPAWKPRVFVRAANSSAELAESEKLYKTLQMSLPHADVYVLVLIDLQSSDGLYSIPSIGNGRVLFYRIHEGLYNDRTLHWRDQMHKIMQTYATGIAAGVRWWGSQSGGLQASPDASLQTLAPDEPREKGIEVLDSIQSLMSLCEPFDGGDTARELYEPKPPVRLLPQPAVKAHVVTLEDQKELSASVESVQTVVEGFQELPCPPQGRTARPHHPGATPEDSLLVSDKEDCQTDPEAGAEVKENKPCMTASQHEGDYTIATCSVAELTERV
mmetsp:Transcript_48703/g.109330  ORF Transcript_48703/g.109330 Transcript_48703/m.109330 type:complete len:1166 (-) Transcript_48703:10-3507(-)